MHLFKSKYRCKVCKETRSNRSNVRRYIKFYDRIQKLSKYNWCMTYDIQFEAVNGNQLFDYLKDLNRSINAITWYHKKSERQIDFIFTDLPVKNINIQIEKKINLRSQSEMHQSTSTGLISNSIYAKQKTIETTNGINIQQ